MPKGKLVNIALALGALLFSLVLIEGVFIFAGPEIYKGFFEYDPEVGFKVRAHVKRFGMLPTNEFGFNARDFKHEKTPGTYRIVVIGDSYCWAGGMEYNFTSFLQRKFDNLLGPGRVEVINTGYPGTHTAEQLPILRRYGMQYHPDLVILSFFAGNDFIDGYPDLRTIVVNDTFFSIRKKHETTIWGRPIVLQPEFFTSLFQRLRVAYSQRKVQQEILPQNLADLGPEPETPSTPLDSFLNLEKSRLEFFSQNPDTQKIFKPNVDYILKAVSDMKTLVEENGAKFAVTIFPDEFQTEKKLFQQILDRYSLKENGYDLELAQNILKKHLETLHVPVIDLLVPLREAAQIKSPYLLQDTHLNRRGNELASEVLFSRLRNWFAHGFSEFITKK